MKTYDDVNASRGLLLDGWMPLKEWLEEVSATPYCPGDPEPRYREHYLLQNQIRDGLEKWVGFPNSLESRHGIVAMASRCIDQAILNGTLRLPESKVPLLGIVADGSGNNIVIVIKDPVVLRESVARLNRIEALSAETWGVDGSLNGRDRIAFEKHEDPAVRRLYASYMRDHAREHV
jgi:hypothetical protein